MSAYAYKAIPAGGAAAAPVTGTLDATNESAARDRLREQGLIALEVRPESAADALRAMLRARESISRKESAWFFRTLHRMLACKAPIETALTTMEELATTDRLRAACGQIRESMRRGEPLHEAAAQVPGLANPSILALLLVGHDSGRLERVCGLIDHSIATRQRLRRAVTGQLTYPAILFAAAVAAVWFLSWFVIPRFASTLEGVGATLPWSTRFTLTASHALIWIAPALLLAVALLIWSKGAWIPASARAWWGAQSLRLPIVKTLVWNAQSAVACETIGTMLDGGGDVLAALELAEGAMSSGELRLRLSSARQLVREGRDLGEALHECRALPPEADAIVRIGLRSGDLPEALQTATARCLEEQEALAERLTTLIEPAMILCMAGVIGWIIYSLISGMLTINDMGAL
ncbi:MAG: type II secretion system F family protein [Phycisphaeraceae bacterium]|nr:type II secretion system F family protein [Phycisphaeraceae bacterium]MCB9847939.1 type II secretion system F family protein [Phycisphaeraceae bacterium]